VARIRSVKPEFFLSETIAALSVPARLTFIGLWTYADDYGRALDNPKLLKAAVWPLDDDMSAGEVAGHLEEFAKTGRICRYAIDGKRYLHVVTWDEHQKPKNPSEPKYPACPKQDHGGDGPGDALPQPYPSTTPADTHDGDSPSLPRARARSREQGAGRGSREGLTPLSLVPSDATPPDPIRIVFDAWVTSFPDPTRRDLTPARQMAIKAALKCYPLKDVADAARGWVNDPWSDRAQQNDLAQLLHMGSKRKPANILERMRDLWRRGPPATLGKQTAQAVATYRQMKQMGGGAGDMGPVDRDRGQAQRELPPPAG